MTSNVEAISLDPTTPSTLYAATSSGVFKSTDAGGSWTQPTVYMMAVALAIDPSDTRILYAGGEAGTAGAYKSTDAGATWVRLLGNAAFALAVHPSAPSTLLAGTNSGLFRTTDAGATWVDVLSNRVHALRFDPLSPTTVYAGSDCGVLASTDSGATWAPANASWPGPYLVQALAVSPTSPVTVYAGLEHASVWQATPPAAPVKGDLNGDGRADLVFRSEIDPRRVKVWIMNGAARSAEAAVVPDAGSAELVVRGIDDFDIDGTNDIFFWNRATGEVQFWLMSGTHRLGAPVALTGAPTLSTNWEPAATADFDHDSWPDIVWLNSTSQKIVIWTMFGTAKKGTIIPTPGQAVHGNWAIVSAGDYNHDGNADLLWYNATSGRLVTWYLDGQVARISGQFTTPPNAGDNNWKVVASADYSGTSGPGTPPLGSPDIVWRNETGGNQVVWHMDFASTRVHGEFTSPPANTPALDWTVVGPR